MLFVFFEPSLTDWNARSTRCWKGRWSLSLSICIVSFSAGECQCWKTRSPTNLFFIVVVVWILWSHNGPWLRYTELFAIVFCCCCRRHRHRCRCIAFTILIALLKSSSNVVIEGQALEAYSEDHVTVGLPPGLAWKYASLQYFLYLISCFAYDLLYRVNCAFLMSHRERERMEKLNRRLAKKRMQARKRLPSLQHRLITRSMLNEVKEKYLQFCGRNGNFFRSSGQTLKHTPGNVRNQNDGTHSHSRSKEGMAITTPHAADEC